MAHATRNIGLSLGADICWPICYEEIINRLNLSIPHKGDKVSFHIERVTIEPYDLRQECKYDVVLDRLTHWYHTSREWIKKAVIMDDLYVLNNPWAIQSMEKQTSYAAMMRLGMPIPETWMVPPKDYERTDDLVRTLKSYARLFDLGEVGEKLGYPIFLKPYDGGGWRGVMKADNEKELKENYERSGKMVLHLQKGVIPYERFVRCIGLGPQLMMVDYDPSAPLHGRYVEGVPAMDETLRQQMRDITLTINSFFCWDFNSCEALLKDQIWYPIDYANPCPDSQVTSLHYHFPWLVMANIRWSIFVATVGRKMRMNHNWEPFFKVAEKDLSYEDKLKEYAKLAHKHFETERFEKFCDKHLGHLDEVAWEFFGTAIAKNAIFQKVSALYPQHEVEKFTEHFWGQIQKWRKDQESK